MAIAKTPVCRARRPSQRREVDAVQPDHRFAAGHRRAAAGHDARCARADASRGGGSPFDLFDTGGLFGASEDPLHELVVVQGQRAIERRRPAGVRRRRPRGPGRRATRRSPPSCARPGRPGHPGREQDRRQARARRRAGVLSARVRPGGRDLRRARHGRRAICSMRSWSSWRPGAEGCRRSPQPAGSPARRSLRAARLHRDRRRHRRPARTSASRRW